MRMQRTNIGPNFFNYSCCFATMLARQTVNNNDVHLQETPAISALTLDDMQSAYFLLIFFGIFRDINIDNIHPIQSLVSPV